MQLAQATNDVRPIGSIAREGDGPTPAFVVELLRDVINIPDRDTHDVEARGRRAAIKGRVQNRRYALNDGAFLNQAVAVGQRRRGLSLAAFGPDQLRVEDVGAEAVEIVLTLSERESLAGAGKFYSAICYERVDRVLGFVHQFLGLINKFDNRLRLLELHRGGGSLNSCRPQRAVFRKRARPRSCCSGPPPQWCWLGRRS